MTCDRCGDKAIHGVMEYRCAHLLAERKIMRVVLCLACEIELAAWITGESMTDDVERAANESH